MRISSDNFLTQLRQKFAPVDGFLLYIMLLITLVSLVTMYSATYTEPIKYGAHLRNFALTWTVIFVFAFIQPHWYMKIAPPLYIMGIVLLLMVAIFGVNVNGSKRWLRIGITIQPSELLKLAVPLMMSFYFHISGHLNIRKQWAIYAIATGIMLVPFFLILKQPDLGTALLIAFSGSYVLFFAGLSWRVITGLFVVGLFMLPLIYLFGLKQYQRDRILTLLDPEKDPLGKGFHILQSQVAIGSGGWIGKGWKNGSQSHLDFLPEHTTDFLLGVYAEEFGFVGVIVLLVLYAMLIFRGLSIAQNAGTRFERLLAGTLTMGFFTYVFVNMGMVAGILPVVGVPLPFMSYGGTAMITLGVGVGMLMSINHNRIV